MKFSMHLRVAAALATLCATASNALSFANDLNYSFGGSIKQEAVRQENPRMLNKFIPDQYGFLKTTIELKNHLDWGKKRFGHRAIEAEVTLRHKSNFGAAGSTDITDVQQVKIGDALLGEIKHNSTKPLMWVKEAWVSATLNALLDMSTNNLHKLKVGFFGFQLGRGIALGEGYGTGGKDFLAIYNRVNDFYAPAIMMSGEFFNKGITYEAFISFLENKSASLKDTFNHVKVNHLGREATPWAGTGNNNTVYALQLAFNPLHTRHSNLVIAPYIMYNEALDQTLEVAADSLSKLATFGSSLELQIGSFGVDCEVAQNFGYEEVARIDRNNITLKQINENIKSVYTHIQLQDGPNWVSAPATADLRAELKANRHLANGEEFTVGLNTYRSANNRIRPTYQNRYRGFMGIIDTYYNIDQLGMVLCSSAGYATGDNNPHTVEANKDYKGFVGLNEYYIGKRVRSLFFFDVRTVKRPMLLSGTSSIQEDNSFTDIIFAGQGIHWSPRAFKNSNLKFNANMLGYFKQLESAAIVKDEQGNFVPSTTEKARRYMGSEFNLIASVEPLDNMCIALKLGMFLPGVYYRDIKGAPLSGDIFNKLDLVDTQELDSQKYRIGNDTAYVANLVFEYRF